MKEGLTLSTLSYENILKLNNKIYVDVRSPLEFKESTIPGAINIPVLLNEEREKVGTLYVDKKLDEAKIFAIESISKRLPEIFKEFLELKKEYENIIVFCSRGGYRSKSIVSLLNSIDVTALRIDGGYKNYRNYVLDNMDNIISTITPIVLYGNTGCGKTKILQELKNRNYPVIDLEGLANHRGSILGSVGLDEQPRQKMFESLLFDELYKYQNSYIFLEGESRRIGKVLLPESLYEKMADNINIKIESPIDYRVELLVEEYACAENKEEIANAISLMKKFISNETLNDLLNALEKDDYEYIARELCINYYDIKYKNRVKNFDFEFTNDDHEKTTEQIIEKTSIYF